MDSEINSLSEESIEKNKKEILRLLSSTGRTGVDKVTRYLEENNFFEVPSSLDRHHNWRGGLAQHCLGVFNRLSQTGNDLPKDSVIITSFLHDICKADKYIKLKNGSWEKRTEIEPGHGSRSVKILRDLGLEMTEEEERAIKWHMGGWKIGERPKEEIREFFAAKKSDLWRLLHNADRFDASHFPANIKPQ